ncbi:MAG: AsmA family protein [Pseudomonadota bacterium]
MRLFIFIGLCLVAALAAALFAPPYIDWNQYRAQFEAEASRYLGQPVKVDGETTVTLLPLPSVTFSDVRVGETSLGTPLMSADSFRMNVELAPLLKGDITIVDMVMTKPVLDLRLDKTGRLDWPEPAAQRARGNQNVALEKLALVDGTIRFTDERTDYNVELSGVDAQASARALQGPWQGTATANAQGERYRIGFNTGLLQADGAMRVKLAVEPQSVAYDFELDGPVKLVGGVPKFEGGLKIRPMPVQGDEDLISFRRPGRESALPIAVEADVNIASAGATISEFKLDIGERDDPYTISGTGQAVFGQSVFVGLQAEGQQVNVEQLEARQKAAGTVSGEANLMARLDLVRQWLRKVPRLPVDGEVKLNLPAVVAGDTTIRDVKMNLQPGETQTAWRIGAFEAQLPGRTELRADGVLEVGEPFSYEGELIVASRQPSGLATWLGAGEANALRRLSNAGLSANARLSADQVQLDGLEIVLDGKTLTGTVLRVAADEAEGQPPQLNIRLSGEAVVTDQFAALFDLFGGDGQGISLAGHEMDVDVQAGQVSRGAVTAQDVALKFQLSGDALNLETLNVGDLAGVQISASGALGGFPEASEGRILGSLKGESLAQFITLARQQEWLGVALPWLEEQPDLTAGADLSGQIEADGEGFAVSLDGGLAAGEVRLSVAGSDPATVLSGQDIEASLVLENPETATLLAQMGLPVVPLENTGRGALRLTLQGTGVEGWRTDGALTLEDGYVSASGVVTVSPGDELAKPSGLLAGLSGALNAVVEAQDTDPYILLSGLPVPGFQNGNAGRVSGQLKFGEGRYALSGMRGKIAGETVQGELVLNTVARPRPNLTGEVRVSALEASTVSALVYTGVDEIVPPLLDGLDGSVRVSVERFLLGEGLPVVGQVSGTTLIRDGELRFDQVAGKALGGALQGQASLSRTSTSRLAEGAFALVGADAGAVSALAGFSAAAGGNVNVTARLETSGTDRTDMLDKLTGSGVAILTEGAVPGLNPNALGDVLSRADALEDNALDGAVPGIVRSSVLDGALPVARVEVPFNITGPLLRVSNFSTQSGDLSVSGKMEYGLGDQTVDLSVGLAFEPGLEAVAGAAPTASVAVNGAASAPNVTVDTTGFSTYLALRRSEAREREFAAQQAEILERQRLQRTARLYALRAEARRIQAAERARLEELAVQQEERRRREEARRRREELERKRLEAELKAAQEQAAREAAAEAGRRAERERRIEELRKAAEEANRRIQDSLNDFDVSQ